jgi:hypothetical protein
VAEWKVRSRPRQRKCEEEAMSVGGGKEAVVMGSAGCCQFFFAGFFPQSSTSHMSCTVYSKLGK